MREKELRLALVCYGGVSLAVYMHGVTKEVWKLLRASATRHGAAVSPLHDSGLVYRALLDGFADRLDLRVMCDILAGASAGGINSILLAHAVATGADMEPLRGLWIDGADVDKLLDRDNAATRLSKLWALPLIWWARRRGVGMTGDLDPAVRAEVAAKLSRLMRSKWFRPPFSGQAFSRMLLDAFAAMSAAPPGPALVPPGQPLDLFVTVTDYHGAPERLRLHSPPSIVETEHRLVIAFHDPGPPRGEGADRAEPRHIAEAAELAFAARATASFPGAFPPAQVGEIDAVLHARQEKWPGRDAFLARVFPRRARAGLSLEGATLIDGSVLNNRPFGPAIEALRHRPAHRDVDRRFVYIDPRPTGPEGALPMRPPGFFATILRSLSDIPREQPIRDNLEVIEALSSRVRRMRHVVDGMAADVDAAIEDAVGRAFFLLPLTPDRLSRWRNRTQGAAARGAGFAFIAYGQLKLAQVVEDSAAMLVALGGFDMRDGAAALRDGVWNAARAEGADAVAAAAERGGQGSPYVQFLRRFDLAFRVRRLRFVIRRLNALAPTLADAPARAELERLKLGLYDVLAPYLERRRHAFFGPAARDAAATGDAPAALAAYEAAMDLRAVDASADAALAALVRPLRTPELRRAALRAYLGFPFYDIALLPLLQGDGLDEFDEVKVDRVSPDDCVSLPPELQLKGTRFNNFGAFFSRAYRENDYLLGRLHGAERLIDILATVQPGLLDPAAIAAAKRDAFRAITDAERPHLRAIPQLFAALDAWAAAEAPGDIRA